MTWHEVILSMLMSGEESKFLIVAVSCSSKIVIGESGLTQSQILSQMHHWKNTVRFHYSHRLWVKDTEAMGGNSLSLLVDEWNKVKLSLAILADLEGKMNM